MNKNKHYFSTLDITKGFFIALLSSTFIYLEYLELSHPILATLFGIATLYLLLQENSKTWFTSGFFIGFFWFWWIFVSFEHYKMLWAIPIGLLVISLSYGIVFWLLAWISEKITSLFTLHSSLFTLTLKAFGLLALSYIHPFGFDWFKPELMFVNSYLGIEKWQFFIILMAIILSIWKNRFLYLFIMLLAYQPAITTTTKENLANSIQLITMNTSVEDKWNKELHKKQFDDILKIIDSAINEKIRLVVLPESVFPIFLNYNHNLIYELKQRAESISIVTGGLYWNENTPHNSTYIFTDNKITIANKVILVPFGESNPLPDFLSNWVNKVFYDGAVDYQASSKITDYKVGDTTYRNAICFEATSEALYAKDKKGNYPKNMIVLSNNGWFTPSIEPTLQRLLLQYYSKKYGTTIYHSVNMSESYVIESGIVLGSKQIK